jgi:hypothetical protein
VLVPLQVPQSVQCPGCVRAPGRALPRYVALPAGATGPTGFLPPGKQRKAGYTDKFLVENGAPPGSTIVMTDTGYMTELAWVEMSPSIADGLRALPVVRDMPQWWMIKFIDGFGAHTSSVAAMEIYADR